MSGFTIDERDGRAYAEGDLDVDTAHLLRALLDDGHRVTLLDLSKVGFIDSSGLSVLLEAVENDPAFRVCNPSSAVRRLIDVTGTAHLLLDEA